MEQRVIKIYPYSYSSLTSFETCPRKHYGERLSKEFARPFSKAADDGTSIHKQAEDYAIEGTTFDNPYRKQITLVVDALKDTEGQFFAEAELAVDKDLKPVGWWDPIAYSRAKIDLLHVTESEATIVDWKTGKPDPYSTQLKHNALLVMMHYPGVEVVRTRYEWLKSNYATTSVIHREFLEADWAKFESRVARYDKAFKADTWPAKQSGLCKNYCGVTTCEFNGKFKTN